MSARSARRPVPALVFLLALAILAVVVWVRVADRDSAATGTSQDNCATAPQLPANAAVTVTVLNAAGKDGLATQVLNSFVADGFAAGNVGNADTPVDGVGTITYGVNGATSGLLVSYWFPGATLQTDERQDASVTVTVGSAFTTLATPEQAAASLAAAKVSQTPPPPAATTAGATASAATSAPAPSATCTTTPPAPTPTPASATPAAS